MRQVDEENGERLRFGDEWRGGIGREAAAVAGVVCGVQTARATRRRHVARPVAAQRQ